MAGAGFSGVLKLADLDDFITPSQVGDYLIIIYILSVKRIVF